MDDNEFPATQPVLPSLLGDVVAFVEVRSGHDNRSRGVISELRSLGAGIAPTLNKDVTHVVFQGGHVSIYKKAKQQMVPVVAVSWIEASKELGYKAPEEEHPPPGFEKYEDPHAARKIKVLKSMQPEFDDEKDDERLNAILARIKKKGAKRSASIEDQVFSEKHGKKKRSTVFDKKHNESTSTSVSISLENSAGKTANAGKTEKSKKRGCSSGGSKATSENDRPPKRTRKSVKKNAKSGSRSGDPSCPTNNETENRQETETGESKVLSRNKINEVDSAVQEPCQKSFEFVMPKPVNKQNGSTKLTLHPKKAGRPQTPSPATHLPSSTAKSETENETSDQKTKEVPSHKERPAQSRPLGFIENITREKDARKVELEDKPQRQTRRSAGPADSVQKSNTSEPQTKEVHPFVARVLETLAKNKRPLVHLKSPWRSQSEGTQRRQSPRLSALRKENCSADPNINESMSPVVPKKMEPRKPVPAVPSSASAHMLKFWKAKSSKVTSPEVALLDISFGPAPISERRSSSVSSASSMSTASSHQGTPGNKFSKSLLETLSIDVTDLDRSDSPILGTRVKRRVVSTGSNSSHISTKSLPGVIPLQNKSSMTEANKSSLPSSVNCSESEGKALNESLDTSSRSRRGSRRKEALPTLVCTHLNGSDVKKVMKAVLTLGKFEFEEQVSERTSHVVASGPRRTINMLRAIARGCWVLRDEWVYRSVEAQRWLPEEDFELTEFSPLVQERRLLRQTPNGLGQWDLLSSVGPIFVSSASQPRPLDLKDLILLSGGTLSKTIEEASLVIGPPVKSSKNKHSKVRVAPVWVLDCIQKGVKLPFTALEHS